MERVWDYPRPPVIDACGHRVRVVFAGVVLADSTRALRVLETSHPPGIYVPAEDVRGDLLEPSRFAATWCEYKGWAGYLDAVTPGRRIEAAAWTYRHPARGYAPLRDHVAFYPGRVDEAWLGDERVAPQPGGFYGGWITADLVGPFKGGPGTSGW